MKTRKAQSGGGAATLVAVIGLLIVLYILFLPPDVREDLLKDNKSSTSLNSGHIVLNLVKETPGRLEELSELQIEHNLPSVNLYSLTGAKVLKKVSSLYVKNGVFDQKSEKITFSMTDSQNTDNVMLSFAVKNAQGSLIIKLNDQEIFNKEITSKNVPPIELPKESLAEQNTLEFLVSDVGAKFWRTNEFNIENIQITADVTDVTAQESKNIFVISQTEKHNLDKAKLKFFADCSPGEVGILDVYVNNHQVFSSIPDCGMLRPIEFSPAFLELGENKIVFRTSKGKYLIDQISVTTNLKEITYPSYYFEIGTDDFQDITDNTNDVNLTVKFVNNQELKRGKIYINGKTISMNTDKAIFSRNIDNYVEEGQNGVKIEPDKSVLDIIEMRIDIVKH